MRLRRNPCFTILTAWRRRLPPLPATPPQPGQLPGRLAERRPRPACGHARRGSGAPTRSRPPGPAGRRVRGRVEARRSASRFVAPRCASTASSSKSFTTRWSRIWSRAASAKLYVWTASARALMKFPDAGSAACMCPAYERRHFGRRPCIEIHGSGPHQAGALGALRSLLGVPISSIDRRAITSVSADAAPGPTSSAGTAWASPLPVQEACDRAVIWLREATSV